MQGSKGPDGQGIIPRAILKVRFSWKSCSHSSRQPLVQRVYEPSPLHHQ